MNYKGSNPPPSPPGPGGIPKPERQSYEAMIKKTQSNSDAVDYISVDLNVVPVKVKSVRFDGLSRTKTDYVQACTKKVLLAKNFGELLERIGDAQKKLRRLDAFAEVGTLIDTSKHYGLPDDYDVTFLLKESQSF